MPDGSSSAAPVTRPGPSSRSTMLRGLLACAFLGSTMNRCDGVGAGLNQGGPCRKDIRHFAPAIKEIAPKLERRHPAPCRRVPLVSRIDPMKMGKSSLGPVGSPPSAGNYDRSRALFSERKQIGLMA